MPGESTPTAMSTTVGSRNTPATTRSPRRPEKRLATASSTPTTATNRPIASNIVTNLCVVVTRHPLADPDEGPDAPVARLTPPLRMPRVAYFGQEASILSTVSLVLCPVIQAVACFQKELAPTAAGMA